MLKSIVKLFGYKNQAVIKITQDEIIVVDINSDLVEIQTRISKHPRSIIGNFFEVEKELKAIVAVVFPSKLKFQEVIICLNGQNEGGYTQIEIRAIQELAYGTGFDLVYVSESDLSNEEARAIFKKKGAGNEFIHF